MEPSLGGTKQTGPQKVAVSAPSATGMQHLQVQRAEAGVGSIMRSRSTDSERLFNNAARYVGILRPPTIQVSMSRSTGQSDGVEYGESETPEIVIEDCFDEVEEQEKVA